MSFGRQQDIDRARAGKVHTMAAVGSRLKNSRLLRSGLPRMARFQEEEVSGEPVS